jgi:3-(3-hydroxy-phenyl)propionate hydroxylase
MDLRLFHGCGRFAVPCGGARHATVGLLRAARPVLLNLGEPGALDIAPWADRVEQVDARYAGAWELPVLGEVPAPRAVVIRPDGHVAWVGDGTDHGLHDALTTWFGPACGH